LLHAGVGDRRLWDGQVAALAEEHLVVRPDLRGWGASPLPGGPFSFVDDVRGLLDALGLEAAAVVANSFGGRVAIDYALAQPERVDALALIAPALTGWEGSPELDAFDEEEEALLDAGRIDEAVELNIRTWLDGHGRGPAPVSPETRASLGEMQRLAFETQIAAYESPEPPRPGGWSDPPAAARLAEIAAPTLVVACAYDQPAFRALAERLAAEIPGARGALIDTAHLPGVERPDELNRLLVDFLAAPVS
jgi:pimeloyl-ACP methyl ester carboxylesterase